MPLFATIRRQAKWLWPLLFLAPIAMMGSKLSELHYRQFERKALLAPKAGASIEACRDHVSALPGKAPRSCDLVITTKDDSGTLIETFHFADASRMTLATREGRWSRTSADCTTASRLMNFALLGFAFIGVALLAHSVRTGRWSWLPGMRVEPMNDFEIVCALYGVVLFGGNLLAVATAECAAMALI